MLTKCELTVSPNGISIILAAFWCDLPFHHILFTRRSQSSYLGIARHCDKTQEKATKSLGD